MKTTLKTILAALMGALTSWAQCALGAQLTPQDVHIDGPLSNIAVEAFRDGDFVGPALFPVVPVGKQSDGYYILNKGDWMRNPTSTLRAPKTPPRRVEFSVSTDTYFARNYALAGENAFETLANADNPVALRQRTVRKVVSDLMRDMEVRIANQVTSVSNVGSGVILAGGNRWSQYQTSDPISDVDSAHAFIHDTTGVIANTLLLDYNTHKIVRRHPVLLDMYKYTRGGFLDDAEIGKCFGVGRILIGNAIRNTAAEGQTATMANIWGNNALLCYVDPTAPSLQTVTFGLAYRWQSPDLPAPMVARVYNDPDPGKKVELTEIGYYEDEKVVARDLAYLINTTL